MKDMKLRKARLTKKLQEMQVEFTLKFKLTDYSSQRDRVIQTAIKDKQYLSRRISMQIPEKDSKITDAIKERIERKKAQRELEL